MEMMRRKRPLQWAAEMTSFFMTVTTLILFIPRGMVVFPTTPHHAKEAYNGTHSTTTTTMAENMALLRRSLQFLDHDQRIVGGAPVEDGEFPFFVHPIGMMICGATLIHPDIILTAAHCEGVFSSGVFIGATQLDGIGTMVAGVDLEFPHPNYGTPNSDDNDIMLVKLTFPVSAPLVQWNTDPSIPMDGDTGTVIGFGYTEENGSYSQELMKVDVDVVPFEQCEEQFEDLTERIMLCAGTESGGRDSCQGDSGGPLLSSSTVQVGIVSFGNGCARPGVPAVYTRVSAFNNWIQLGICDLSDSPPAYCDTLTISPTLQPTVQPSIAPTTTAPVAQTIAPSTGEPTMLAPVTTTDAPSTSAPIATTLAPMSVAPTSSPMETMTEAPSARPSTNAPIFLPIPTTPETTAPITFKTFPPHLGRPTPPETRAPSLLKTFAPYNGKGGKGGKGDKSGKGHASKKSAKGKKSKKKSKKKKRKKIIYYADGSKGKTGKGKVNWSHLSDDIIEPHHDDELKSVLHPYFLDTVDTNTTTTSTTTTTFSTAVSTSQLPDASSPLTSVLNELEYLAGNW